MANENIFSTLQNEYDIQVDYVAIKSNGEIDISDLSQGVYFIQLNGNNQLISKIVKY